MSDSAAHHLRWFFAGVLTGEVLVVLSLHFLTRPGLRPNWPVIAASLVALALIVAYDRIEARRG